MKTIFKNTLIIVGLLALFVAAKKNLEDGKESVDITWVKYINISDSSYLDIDYQARKMDAPAFRVFNGEDTASTIFGQPKNNNDTVLIKLAPLSWSPIVFKSVFQYSGKADSVILIGK